MQKAGRAFGRKRGTFGKLALQGKRGGSICKALPWLAVPLATACTGMIGEPDVGNPGDPIRPDRTTDSPSTGTSTALGDTAIEDGEGGTIVIPDRRPPDTSIAEMCTPELVRGIDHDGIRKLGKREMLRALQRAVRRHDSYELDQLAESRSFAYSPLAARDPLQVALNQYPNDTTDRPGEDFVRVFSEAQLRSWLEVADGAATYFVNGDWAHAYSDACDSDSEACRRDVARDFGREVFRRPLDDEEIDALITSTNSLHELVSRLLQSPQFAFLLELGEASVSDPQGRLRLRDHEVANRLAFALTGRPPDTELRAAADAGSLDSLEAVHAHAARIVRTDAAREHLLELFYHWLRLGEVTDPSSGWANFAQLPAPCCADLYNNGGLEAQLQREALDYVRHIVWEREGSFADLMTTRIAFPRSEKMARIYGTGGYSSEPRPYDAPNHPGLVTRAAILGTAADNPSPIRRGVMVKEAFLCQTIPSPDFTVVATRQVELAALDPRLMPNHQIIRELTSSETCYGCHQHINPIGFVFESFNPLGQHQDVQHVILSKFEFPEYGRPEPSTPNGVTWAEFTSFPLPDGPFRFSIDGEERSLDSPTQLVDALADSDEARSCLSVRIFRHYYHRPERPGDACALSETADSLREGSVLEALVQGIANEDIFWRKP